MATLVLGSAGETLGASLFGVPGAIAGRLAGSLAGASIDRRLFAPSERPPPHGGEGIPLLRSTEGAVIPRVFGTVRVGGQVIWASPYRHRKGAAGQGKGSRPSQPQSDSYSVSLAVGLAEGEISSLGRIWADGKILDSANLQFRLYKGSEDQLPDPAIEAVLGAEDCPAYRGLAYLLFEDLDLAPFGNRIPQFSFEISRTLSPVSEKIRAVNMIPGATEFGYHPVAHRRNAGFSKTESENVHNAQGISDWSLALDQLGEHCPSCGYVSLVVSWFGNDLRAGHCLIRPGVESHDRRTAPGEWQVSGIARRNAFVVSRKDGRPAFGGTPSDGSVLAALRDLKRRGYKILFYPFLLMDIPPGNQLPDPYGGSEQPAYPWRGYISSHIAPGQPGSPDGTLAVKEEVDKFFGHARPDDFRIRGEAVSFHGAQADVGGLKRMILHYAHLCRLAGGVDAFLVGSELRGITRLRHGPGAFLAAERLTELAREVKRILPQAKCSYAADWSEYGHYVPPASPQARLFPLDGFWADAAVDFVGIDYYMPLADWRDGDDHLDARAGVAEIYNLDYLRGNIRGGEYFNWYYDRPAARTAQRRSPIDTDSDSWRWRAKDIAGWWRNRHSQTVIPPEGPPQQSDTAWQPGAKPVWLTETGCAAVDKAANQPNVFFDPKSSDSARPHFSSGRRDDVMQARYLEAMLTALNPDDPAFIAAANPAAPDDPARLMLSPDHIFIWAWDARPYPAFPEREDVWGDAPHWATGHWINGRLTTAGLAQTIADILHYAGFRDFSIEGLNAFLRGFIIDEVDTPRAALERLMRLFFFDAVQSGSLLRFFPRRRAAAPVHLEAETFAVAEGEPWQFTRSQKSDLPASVKLFYLDHAAAYRQAVAEARLPSGSAAPAALARLPVVAEASEAEAAAERWLRESRVAGERASLLLPPSRMALEPGDVIAFKDHLLRIVNLQEGDARRVEAVCCDPELYAPAFFTPAAPRVAGPAQSLYGPPEVFALDLPALRGENPYQFYLAATADPWPGALSLFRSTAQDHGFEALTSIRQRAAMGVSRSALAAHPPGRWDEINQIEVALASGELASRPAPDVLNGANLAALRPPAAQGQGAAREWEIFQFREAELIGENLYRLSGLLRGLAGSDRQAFIAKQAGAEFVLLDDALHTLNLGAAAKGRRFFLRIGPPGKAHGDESYAALAAPFKFLALRPYAPVHLQARHTQDGGILFSWIRRTRIGGDSWDGADAPLGEETESYLLEILKAGKVVRRFTPATPSLLYPNDLIFADFGTSSPRIHVRLYQTNRLFGRSPPQEASFNV